MNKILVFGSGAWATALSQVLLRNPNNEVSIYGINEDELNELRNGRNSKFFKRWKLNKNYKYITNDLEIVKKEQFQYFLMAIPSESIDSVMQNVLKKVDYEFEVINAAKGFISDKTFTVSELIEGYYDPKIKDYSTILGPGFAIDVVQDKFTVLNIVNNNLKKAKKLCSLFDNKNFITFPTHHVQAAEICANMKNPLAIVTGILNGLNASINVIAAFIARGIQEIANLLKAMKLEDRIIQQYCGIGDIFLTCTSKKSRNYTLGLLLAKYNDINEALKYNDKTVEGKNACLIACELFKEYNVETLIFKNLKRLIKNDITTNQFFELTNQEFKDNGI